MKTATLPYNLSIHYEETGHGTPLVWLHGFPLDRAMWVPQLDGLSASARVIAPDLPGFGNSTSGGGAFTIESAANTIAEFLGAIGITEKIVLGGLSMGGYIALAFARRHGERLRGLILADTKAEPDDDTAKANRAKTITLAQEKGAGGVIESMIPKLLGPATLEIRPAVVEEVKRIGSRQSTEAIVRAVEALRDRPDAVPGLANISVPTLVLVGDQDAITPLAVAEKLAGGIPGAKLVVVPTAGHMSNLENPDVFNSAVAEFLSTC